jgi:sortase A
MPRIRIRYEYEEPRYGKFWMRWVCLGGALFCFGWAGTAWLDQRMHQAEAKESFEEMISAPTPEPAAPKHTPKKREQRPMARLEIARLSVSGYIEDGFDSRTLGHAIGHAPQSAKPGQPGNVVLAAHRDTFFSGLRDVQVGDVVNMQAANGEKYYYKVSRVLVIDPKETWVLQSSPSESMLTMITCYPFHFIGSAPNRFVVQAQPIQASEAAQLRSRKGEL